MKKKIWYLTHWEKKNQTCSAVWTWLAAKSSGACLKKNVEHGKKPTMNCKTLNWNKGTEYLETAEQDKGGSKTAEHAQSAYTQGNANQKLTIIQQAQKGQCKMSVQRRLEDNMAQLKWFWVQILLITLQVLWSKCRSFSYDRLILYWFALAQILSCGNAELDGGGEIRSARNHEKWSWASLRLAICICISLRISVNDSISIHPQLKISEQSLICLTWWILHRRSSTSDISTSGS